MNFETIQELGTMAVVGFVSGVATTLLKLLPLITPPIFPQWSYNLTASVIILILLFWSRAEGVLQTNGAETVVLCIVSMGLTILGGFFIPDPTKMYEASQHSRANKE